MSAVVSPATLQQICEAAAATWLTDWSGLVGRVSARAASQQLRSHGTKQKTELPSSEHFVTDATSLCIPYCSCTGNSYPEMSVVLKEVNSRGSVLKKCRSCRCRKKAKKVDKPIVVQYDSEVSSSHGQCEDTVLSQYLGSGNHDIISALQLKQDTNNKCNGMQDTCNTPSRTSFAEAFDKEIINTNVGNCSNFFKHFLPPVLVNQITSLAWKQLSRLVALGSHCECVEEYQVADWVRRAPALLQLSSKFSSKSFPLNISGIPDNLVEDVLKVINQHFPLGALNAFVLPKTNFKRSQLDFSSICKDVYKDILLRTSLTSVILNSVICDDSILSTLSQLPLKELEIGGSSASEKGIISGLCSLPVETASEVIVLVKCGLLQSCLQSPLRKHLQKLDMSFQNLPNSVYHIVPCVFSGLLYYNPHRNMVQCVQSFAGLTRVNDCIIPSLVSQRTLNLLKINVGHSNRGSLTDIARTCPQLQELTLIVDLDAEETLAAIENFHHILHLEITYYPSFPSSPPKLNAGILQAVINRFRPQLRSLSLTGFNIPGIILCQLSQLPELYHLCLVDCWLSNPRILPLNPFPSLGKLRLNFLPPNTTLQLLTMGGGVQSLHLDFKGSEWEGNALTDANIKYLVTSGMIKSLQTLTVTSSYLTLDSLKTVASLPCLKAVGNLASWGLTDEELRCIDHSGPRHILCSL